MVPLVKICGLSESDTLAVALAGGADRIGLVFFAKSPRHVSLEKAAGLAAQARGVAHVVALTVDAEDAALDAMIRAVEPDMLQLHGRETPERVASIRSRFRLPVIKALGISAPADLASVPSYAAVADEILFDAKPPRGSSLPGGNGVAFDWRILATLDLVVPFMLSGGLDPENVRRAVTETGAPAVDVSSGVESAPGVKSAERIQAFLRAARTPA